MSRDNYNMNRDNYTIANHHNECATNERSISTFAHDRHQFQTHLDHRDDEPKRFQI